MTEFKAYEVNFQGETGYMVSQFINGKRVVEQFIPQNSFEGFSDAIGMKIKIVEKSEVDQYEIY
jgi:hypothetical protein